MRAAFLVTGLVWASTATASDTKPWSGEVAATYGRSIGQELNVGGLVGEVKKNVGGQVAMGLRVGGLLGAGRREGGASAYAATPVLFKAELFPTRTHLRPFLGAGLGATFFSVGGVSVAGAGLDTEATAFGAQGPLFTVMPEVGVDLGGFRLAVQHSFLLGSPSSVSGSLALADADISDYDTPALGTTTLQIGGHFGGPRARTP